MKATMKRADVLELNRALDSLRRVRETRFAYAVAKNKQAIKSEVESIQAANEPSERMKEFEQRRMQLVMTYAVRDTDGNIVDAAPGRAKIQSDKESEFMSKIGALTKEFSDIQDSMKTKLDEINNLLEGEVELDLYAVKADVLPDDIASDEMLAIMPLITGDIESVLAAKAAK